MGMFLNMLVTRVSRLGHQKCQVHVGETSVPLILLLTTADVPALHYHAAGSFPSQEKSFNSTPEWCDEIGEDASARIYEQQNRSLF